MDKIARRVFAIHTEEEFHTLALDVFRFQADHNRIYRKYIDLTGVNPAEVRNVEQIPFLPVTFFKQYRVTSFTDDPQLVFTSSGTTASTPATHYVYNASLYEESFIRTFRSFYGNPDQMVILALLPSYLERKGSSLVYMVDKLITLSGDLQSGFYLNEYEKLYRMLLSLAEKEIRVLLFGVSFALLDFAGQYEVDIPGLMVMETGGMKGKRREMIREELHQRLMHRFHLSSIHSEYGMTELLSQAYSAGEGFFRTPPWMKVYIRDPYDPFTLIPPGRHGGINIIDLANLYSCSFLETGDLGVVHADGSFSVLGRFDQSELRGCNLMVQEI